MSGPSSTGQALRRLRWGLREAPLAYPYELSFTTLTHFDVIWVSAEYDTGEVGLGEAVPLPGYNWETTDSISATVAALCGDGNHVSVPALIDACRDVRNQHPFAASAVMAALEMPRYIGGLDSGLRFPISAPVSSDWPLDKIRQTVEARLQAGYNFIKVKVGRDLHKDAAAARCVLTEWPGRRFGVVFDANQAHTFDAAASFARVLRDCASDRLQWYEQPLDLRDWDGLAKLCRTAAVPIVLDESIYDHGHVARAAAMGAFGIKLKLVKNFGIAETLALAQSARRAGLAVVFGNGVASDIGNLGEYLTLAEGRSLFAAASESSGFAKVTEPLLGRILSITGEGDFVSTVSSQEINSRVRAFMGAHAEAL